MPKPRLLYVDTVNANSGYRSKGFVQAGWNVRCFHPDQGKMLSGVLEEFNPQVMFINLAVMLNDNFPLETIIRASGIKIFLFVGDVSRHTFKSVSKYAGIIDVLLISNSDDRMARYFTKNGFKKVVEYHCATDPDSFCPIDNEPEKNAVFIGNYVVRSKDYLFRNKMVRELYKSGQLALYGGNRWGFEGVRRCMLHNFSEAASDGKFHLVINGFGFLENCYSNRTWNALACGRPVLHYRTLGSDKYFKDGQNIIFFSSKGEFYEKLEHYLSRPDEAKAIGENGRKLVVGQHTYKQRGIQLKDIHNGL